MISNCHFEGRRLHFGQNRYGGQNKFTVIVGKNGTGKSRLLSALVKDLINRHHSRDFYGAKPPFPFQDVEIDYEKLPLKVVAASTNPFDKFPLEGRQVGSELYNYLGLRGLQTTNLGLSSRTIFAVKVRLAMQQGLSDEALGVERGRAAYAA